VFHASFMENNRRLSLKIVIWQKIFGALITFYLTCIAKSQKNNIYENNEQKS